jgi:aminoglycoside 6'-N-acetyltransferase I
MSESPAYRIRLATAADRPEWLRLRLLLWPREEPAQLEDDMDSMLQDPRTPVFVVERPGGGLGAFLEAGTRPYADGCDTRPVGYIEGWFVDEDLRRQGLGRLLVAAAEDWARSLGLREMASDTDLSNQNGLSAHLALGYKETERLIHFSKTL